MSYRRSYHQRIAVHYSGSVTYPSSEHGGTTGYSGTAYEDVCVNIDVDTNPFDRKVADCNNSVNLLTGAVVATEAAQIVSIDSNAKRVAGTIIEGFFKNVHFEISAQIAELAQKIDAYLLHLRELSKQLIAKKAQMEVDYNRTSSRYSKVFEDLNNELSNRIFELDKPAFAFKQLADNHSRRSTDNDLVGAVAVTSAESGDLQVRISASISKKRTLDTINQVNIFLTKQKCLQRTINQSMLNDNTETTKFSPVCFLETLDEKNQINKSIYQSDYLPKMQDNDVIESFQTRQWTTASKDNQGKISHYFNAELSKVYAAADKHTNRVRDMIVKIFDFNSIKSV
ncbi:MAG: hypothetical protein LBB41_05055 [Prevotellaceae bacterium]|jgi:hypothetical protein|nr:hypothetical protein [Prevotellaceae bacterium]